MPYPNEHACRLNDPAKYDKVRRVNGDMESDGKKIDVIYGIKDGKSEIQAFRYPKGTWSAVDARSHCKSHEGSFEAASGGDSMPCNCEKEIRSYPIDLRIEKRENKDASPKIVGHAAVFDKLSEDLGGFKEKVAKGAFSKTLKEADIRALWNHDSNYVLGRNKAGTLKLDEDKEGLSVEIAPPDTTWARDLQTSMERGDVDQMSFGFRVVKEEWDDTDKANVVRTLSEVELFDVSPVTYPAYPQTSVSVKRHLEQLQAEPGRSHSDEAHEPGAFSHSAWLRKAKAALVERDL